MKILHIFKITGISGSENHLLTLLPRLAERGLEVVVIMMVEPGNPVNEFSQILEKSGVRIFRVIIGFHISLPAFLKIKGIIKAEMPNIVHTHLIHGDFYGTLAARQVGIKRIITSKHNDDNFRRMRLIRYFNRYFNRRAEKVIVISSALEHFCIKFEHVDPGKIEVIRYGLDDFSSKLGDLDLREKLGYQSEDILFGIIARLTEQKGHVYLIRAFREVKKKYPRAKLLVVGSGEMKEELEGLVSELNLDTVVKFTGRREDTADIYHALDVFVHPSIWEGFGLVFLEAMSFSLSIIATRVSAIPEVVKDGETGILVSPKNITELAEAMIWMIENPAKRVKMGRFGKNRVDRVFPVDKMVDKIIGIYKTPQINQNG
jgi:glycosyltransferase involved in cell wall biosynthesis